MQLRFGPDDLDRAPRKFAVGPDEAPVLCRSVQAMVEFLAVTGRLGGGVASAARVMMHVDGLVDDVADALGDDANFGIGTALSDLVTGPDRYGMSPLIVSGSMTLTPLGRAAMVDPVRQAGCTFATIDDLTDADGLTLVNTVGSLDEDGALANWRPDSPTTERARLLVDAAVAARFPVQRLVAFDLLGRLEPLVDVGPAVRELLDTHCSGRAAAFLLEHDLATDDEIAAFVDIGPSST